MKHGKTPIRYLLCILALCLLAAGCGKQDAPAPAANESVLRYASPDYTTINPLLNTHDELPNLIFSGLLTYDAKGKPIPELAEAYSFDQASLTYRFQLRRNVKWHDGQPFTASDVKFTLDLLREAKDLSASITDNYKEIASVSTPDDFTVEIKLSQPNAAMLDHLTVGLLPKHLLAGKSIMTDAFNQHPIGTGRYKFALWDVGQSIVLEKNADYYKKLPAIDKLVFKIIPDENAKAMEMRAGGVDLAWLNAQNAQGFRSDSAYSVHDFATADYRAIAPNFNAPFWRENRALIGLLGYALDKEAILKSVLAARGEVAYSPIQRNAFYNNPSVDQRAYDPANFKQAVEALGWQRGADGIYEKDGRKLSFSVDAREYETERVDLAKVAAQQLREAGIDMQVRIVSKLDWSTLEAFLIGQAAPFDPDTGTFALFGTNASGNYTAYSNPEADRCLHAARATYDDAQRKENYARFQEAWAKDPAYVMLAYLDGSYVAAKKLRGLSTERILGHHAVGVFWNVEDWTLEK